MNALTIALITLAAYIVAYMLYARFFARRVLGLLTVSLFLYRLGKPIVYTLVPMVGMLVMTVTAMTIRLKTNYEAGHWPLLVVGAVILLLVLWLVIESFIVFARHRGRGALSEGETGEQAV